MRERDSHVMWTLCLWKREIANDAATASCYCSGRIEGHGCCQWERRVGERDWIGDIWTLKFVLSISWVNGFFRGMLIAVKPLHLNFKTFILVPELLISFLSIFNLNYTSFFFFL